MCVALNLSLKITGGGEIEMVVQATLRTSTELLALGYTCNLLIQNLPDHSPLSPSWPFVVVVVVWKFFLDLIQLYRSLWQFRCWPRIVKV